MLLQTALIFGTALLFLAMAGYLSFFSALYGGLISLINNYLIILVSKTQNDNAMRVVALMVSNVVLRMTIVSSLILFGFMVRLEFFALIAGLFLGQCGLILEKLKKIK